MDNNTGMSLWLANEKNIQDVDKCVEFIKEYRDLEKMNLAVAKDYIENALASEPVNKVNRVVEQWGLKKKDFGTFFFNIDVNQRILIYNSFGIEDVVDSEYLLKIKENSLATLFSDTSSTYTLLSNLLVFFNNHGITVKPTEYLSLNNIPTFGGKSFDRTDPTFGNSKNWGNYILSLPEDEQNRILGTINNNYQK